MRFGGRLRPLLLLVRVCRLQVQQRGHAGLEQARAEAVAAFHSPLRAVQASCSVFRFYRTPWKCFPCAALNEALVP